MFKLSQFLFSMLLTLLKFSPLPHQCLFSSWLCCLNFRFSGQSFLCCSPLTLHLYPRLRFPSLLISLVHFHFPPLHLLSLLIEYRLCLCLELLLLSAFVHLSQTCLPLPLSLHFFLLRYELLFLLVCYVRHPFLLRKLFLGLLSLAFLFLSFAFFLLHVKHLDLLSPSFLLLALLLHLLFIYLFDLLYGDLVVKHLLDLFLLTGPDLLKDAFFTLDHRRFWNTSVTGHLRYATRDALRHAGCMCVWGKGNWRVAVTDARINKFWTVTVRSIVRK